MKRNYLLIISGVIPLLFVIFLLRFFGEDERYQTMQKAKLLTKENIETISHEDFVLIYGQISTNQPTFSNGFVAYQVEEKVRERDRSVWKTSESHIPILTVTTSTGLEVKLNLDEGYVLCGSFIQIQKIPNKDPKKNRILGLPPNAQVTAYGKILSTNPLVVHVGKSMCAETIVEYQASLSKKNYTYILAVLCLAIPSLFLIYLGLFRAEG